MKKNSFLFHKILYYGIHGGNLTFENQSFSNNPSVGNFIFLKNIIQLFDKPLRFSSHKDQRKENKTECKKWTWIDIS